MGYESKIFVVDVHRNKNYGDKSFGEAFWTETIAVFNMCKMGYDNGWQELFDKPIDYEICINDNECWTLVDKYGEHLKSADFDKVIQWLETTGQEMDYRRITPLLGMLKGFNRSEWGELQVVHYGY